MKYILFLFVALLVGCGDDAPVAPPAPPPPPPKPVVKTIAGKISQQEPSTTLDVWGTLTRKGIHTHETLVTHYYVIFTDGTKAEIPMEEYAVVNVGDKKEMRR